jgi:hypothetical protein
MFSVPPLTGLPLLDELVLVVPELPHAVIVPAARAATATAAKRFDTGFMSMLLRARRLARA